MGYPGPHCDLFGCETVVDYSTDTIVVFGDGRRAECRQFFDDGRPSRLIARGKTKALRDYLQRTLTDGGMVRGLLVTMDHAIESREGLDKAAAAYKKARG